MTPSYDVQRLTDRAAIRAFLNTDRGMTAYALGDLDDAYWPQSTFYGARVGGKLASVLLTYHGLEPMIFTGFGDTNGMAAIFADLLLPEEIYYVFLPEMEWILAEWYDGLDQYLHREWRMVLDPQNFAAPAPIQETVFAWGQNTRTPWRRCTRWRQNRAKRLSRFRPGRSRTACFMAFGKAIIWWRLPGRTCGPLRNGWLRWVTSSLGPTAGGAGWDRPVRGRLSLKPLLLA